MTAERRRDITREIQLLLAAMEARNGTLQRVVDAVPQGVEEIDQLSEEGQDLVLAVAEESRAEAELLLRLTQLMDALTDTFPAVPEDQVPKTN